MFCPQCANFVATDSKGGVANRVCTVCPFQAREPELRILKSFFGPSRLESSEGMSEELKALAQDLSDDPTIYQPPSIYCPKCGTQVKAYTMRDQRYLFVCPKCRDKVYPNL